MSIDKRPAEIFAGLILAGQLDAGGGYDGLEIQELLVKSGLCRQVTATKACGESCLCAEYGFPIRCNKLTKAGKAALKSSRNSRGEREAPDLCGVDGMKKTSFCRICGGRLAHARAYILALCAKCRKATS